MSLVSTKFYANLSQFTEKVLRKILWNMHEYEISTSAAENEEVMTASLGKTIKYQTK